jgi:sulfatase maturation enzyme AslB (radical SAM superfamily)
MYIQITTRCNMTCEHCCMRATAKGADMSREVFLEAMKMAESYGHCITIGGGEPTIHPLLFDFIGIALAHSDYQQVHIITNGKISSSAYRLAKMARAGFLGCDLSRDPWHDAIDPRVVEAFTQGKDKYGSDARDLRGIRTVTSILPVGRALDNGMGTENGCACDDLFVSPDGKLWACGHQEQQFGTVFDPDIDEDFESGSCSHDFSLEEVAA